MEPETREDPPGLNPPPPRSRPRVSLAIVLVLLCTCGFVFLAAWQLRLLRLVKMPSGSMKPTLNEGQTVVVTPAWGALKDGDVIEFVPPVWAVTPKDLDSEGHVAITFLKRVVGVPGDLIEIKNGIVYRNGVAQQEPFTKERSDVDFKLVYYKGEYWPLAMTGSGVNEGENTAPHFRLEDPNEMNRLRALPAAHSPRPLSRDGRQPQSIFRWAVLGTHHAQPSCWKSAPVISLPS